MSATTRIEWTDSTINFWWGCTKIGPGCDHCYAEAWDARFGGAHWGSGAARKKIIHAGDNLLGLYAGAVRFLQKHGRKRRIFIQSMSDFFDNEVDPKWREAAWADMRRVDGLNLQILTKRIGNVAKMTDDLPWPHNAGLMITVVNQAEADRDIPRLLDLKQSLCIPWVGLSIEPMLGRIILKAEWLAALDWIILGGESGPAARPMHPDWARLIRDQCATFGVPFFFKQCGEWAVEYDREVEDPDWRRCPRDDQHPNARYLNLAGGFGFHGERVLYVRKVGKRRAGRRLDGIEHNQFPEALS